MIVYDLQCRRGHVFETWFPNDEAFEAQSKGGKVTCPHCGGHKVEKAIMAPNLAVKAGSEKSAKPRPAGRAGSGGPVVGGKTLNPKVAEALQALREEVEKNCDYVGENFAEEARKIHYGERDPRGIYGQTSLDEAKALDEEGIAVQPLPFPLRNS